MATDKLILPEGYAPRLSVRETQKGIKVIKDNFQRYLAVALNSSDRYGDCMRMMDYAYREGGVLSAEIVDDME